MPPCAPTPWGWELLNMIQQVPSVTLCLYRPSHRLKPTSTWPQNHTWRWLNWHCHAQRCPNKIKWRCFCPHSEHPGSMAQTHPILICWELTQQEGFYATRHAKGCRPEFWTQILKSHSFHPMPISPFLTCNSAINKCKKKRRYELVFKILKK